MKEIILGFAEYNREANRKLVAIVSPLDEALLREDQGSFYKSILGTLEHVALAEVAWLRRYAGFFAYACLSSSPLLAAPPESLAARIKGGPASLFAALAEIDDLFVSFAGELGEASLGSRVKYSNPKGEEQERTYWNVIFHVLNHGTHHRGEISAMLDRKSVANDYSGFNFYRK
jgi:uncharacterized damage-inducible protein DinB